MRWSDALFGYTVGSKREELSFDRRDSARGMPKCKVIDPAFTWGEDRRPRVPWNDMIIYETHVRGFTMRHPDVPPAMRGKYAGLASAPAIEYLKRLGVTTVELMPVHAFVDDRYLVERGLANYWGYNTIGYFAPEARYSASGKVAEFKTMVKTLHSRRPRGHTRRGLQPHRRRRPPGADAVVSRPGQRLLLPPHSGGPPLLRRLHRLRQHAQHARIRACCR